MLLNKLRKGAAGGITKFILFGFMAMAVGGMVFMDVGGFFRGGVQRNSVAKIGREQISAVSFDNTVRRILSAQNIDAATAFRLGYIDQIMTSTISTDLMYRAAQKAGLQVGDREVSAHISKLIEPMVTDGKSKKEVLKRLLLTQGMSEDQFVSELRRDISSSVLRGALQSAASFTPPQEARDLYQYQNEERTIKAVILPDSGIKDFKHPSDEVLLPFYQAGQERYAIPETRTFSIAILRDDDIKKTLDVSNEELRKIYEDSISSYTLPEQRVMEQAVLTDEAAAKKVYDAVKDGKNMKEAVKAATGSADAYLGKETFQQDGLTKEIGDAAFAAKKGDAVGPVKTALGWHVLAVNDILPPSTKPFADVKADIKKEALHDKLADQLYAASAQIDDMLAGGETLEEVAKSMNLKVQTFGPLRDNGSTPDSKEGLKDFDRDRNSIIQTVFELTEGETAPVMQLDDGGYAAIRVDTITPKSYKPFDEVKKNLAEIWIADQKSVLNKQRASDALRALANREKTLEQVARENGISVQTIKMKRGDDPPKEISAPTKTKFFETPQDGYAVSGVDSGYIVGQVTSISLPDLSKIKDTNLDETAAIATQGTRDEFLLAFLQNLYDDAKVTVNRPLLQQMYGPGSEGN